MLRCIQAYVSNLALKVSVGTTLSDRFTKTLGVPHGGVLRVTLLAVKINSLCDVIPPSIS